MSAVDDLMVPLNRPQYVPASEVLVSSLVHRCHSRPEGDSGAKGYRFLGTEDKAKVVTTGPSTSKERAAFAELLTAAGMKTDAPDYDLAECVVEAVKGVYASGSKTIPAAPMTPMLALTQDMGGVGGTANPPDIGGILEVMFLLGEPGTHEDTSTSMGELWLDAAAQRLREDPVLSVVDSALSEWPPLTGFVRKEPRAVGEGWRGRAASGTPFRWLHDSWCKLMSPAWVDAMPARVWTDWCTMLLRTGLAFGFLWEARWYESLGRMLLAPDREALQALPSMSAEVLLPWPPARLPVASRSVKSEIRQLVSRGLEVRGVLLAQLDTAGDLDGLAAISRLRQDERVRGAVRTAMSGRIWNRRCNNTYETIIYVLQQRNSAALATDYYGFLRPHGTVYSVVSPGTEWFAVVASLACPGPGSETNVGAVMTALAQIGLRPELQEVVRALESAGLARGSADADHGVRVRSAF